MLDRLLPECEAVKQRSCFRMMFDSMLYRRQSNKSLINFKYKKRAVVHTALIQEYSDFQFARRGLKCGNIQMRKTPLCGYIARQTASNPFQCLTDTSLNFLNRGKRTHKRPLTYLMSGFHIITSIVRQRNLKESNLY